MLYRKLTFWRFVESLNNKVFSVNILVILRLKISLKFQTSDTVLLSKMESKNVTSNQWEKQKDVIVYSCNNKHFKGDFVKMKYNNFKHFNWVYLITVLIHFVRLVFYLTHFFLHLTAYVP